MRQMVNPAWNRMMQVCWTFAAAGLLAGCAASEDVAKTSEGAVESRGMPQMQRPMQPGMPMRPGMPAQPGAPAQANIQLPTWPQKWDVNNREPAGFGFGVTQPGAVTVDVQAQGAPVIVALYGATPQPVQQQAGAGAIRLMYQVTPADVQRSALWQVRIALAQPGGPPTQAAGTIAVQHPPADVNAVRAQVRLELAQRRASVSQSEVATKPKTDASFQSELAKFHQEQMARRAAISAELQPHLQAARARMQGQIIRRGVESGEASEPSAATAEDDVTTRGLLDRSQPLIVAPQGTQTFKASIPPPYITWVSRPNAQPGDELLVTGDFFGQQAPGNKLTMTLLADPPNGGPVTLVANVIEWREGLIHFTVPTDTSGIMRARQVDWFITRGSDGVSSVQPQGLPFQFYPAMQLLELPLPPSPVDSYVHRPGGVDSTAGMASAIPADTEIPDGWSNANPFLDGWFVYLATELFVGDKGFDTFFVTKALKNGWTVESTAVTVECIFQTTYFGPTAGAYITFDRRGTTSPFIVVRTWQQPIALLCYKPHVFIQGPKGVPYE